MDNINMNEVMRDMVAFAMDHIAENKITARDDDVVDTIGKIFNKSFSGFDATDEYLSEEIARRAERAKEDIAKALDKLYTEEWEAEFKRAGKFNPNPRVDPNYAYAKSEGTDAPSVSGERPTEAELEAMKKRAGDAVAASDKDDAAVANKYKMKYSGKGVDAAYMNKVANENPNTTKKSMENLTISDILTNHPLHRFAHEMDDNGYGFDWSKCPSNIDMEFVPREIVEELNRRHGPNYYPHVHAEDPVLQKSTVYYDKSATNIIQEEFSEMHETLHRVDHSAFTKGETLGLGQIYAQLENGATMNYAGGQMSGELLDHINSHHGAHWDSHALLVPVLKAYNPEMTAEDAMRGGGWELFPLPFQKGVKGALNKVADVAGAVGTVAPAVATLAPHPGIKTGAAVASVAAPVVSAGARALANKLPDDPLKMNKADAAIDAVQSMFQQALEKSGGDKDKALQMVVQAIIQQSGGKMDEQQATQMVVQALQSAAGGQAPAEGSASTGEEAPAGSPAEGGGEDQEEAEPPVPPSKNNPAEEVRKARMQIDGLGIQSVRAVDMTDTAEGFERMVTDFYKSNGKREMADKNAAEDLKKNDTRLRNEATKVGEKMKLFPKGTSDKKGN